jgi:hypothetical protein
MFSGKSYTKLKIWRGVKIGRNVQNGVVIINYFSLKLIYCEKNVFMEFEEYLKQKKINADHFKKNDPARFEEWQALFTTMHPESFTAQKKFLINDIRRRYLLSE